jgi:hypothetical protein
MITIVAVKPEFALQASLCLMLISAGCYIQSILMLPMAIYSGYKIAKSDCIHQDLISNVKALLPLEPSNLYGASVESDVLW